MESWNLGNRDSFAFVGVLVRDYLLMNNKYNGYGIYCFQRFTVKVNGCLKKLRNLNS